MPCENGWRRMAARCRARSPRPSTSSPRCRRQGTLADPQGSGGMSLKTSSRSGGRKAEGERAGGGIRRNDSPSPLPLVPTPSSTPTAVRGQAVPACRGGRRNAAMPQASRAHGGTPVIAGCARSAARTNLPHVHPAQWMSPLRFALQHSPMIVPRRARGARRPVPKLVVLASAPPSAASLLLSHPPARGNVKGHVRRAWLRWKRPARARLLPG